MNENSEQAMIDQDTFFRHVRTMYSRLDDRPYLLSHPLTPHLAEPGQAMSAERLRQLLLGTLGQLRPPQGVGPGLASWRRWRCLSMRYEEAIGLKRIAHELQISDRQARRDHRLGLDAVAGILWDRYRKLEAARGRLPDPATEAAPLRARETGMSGADNLEAELAMLLAVAPQERTSVVHVLESALSTVRSMAEAHQARFIVSSPESPCSAAVNQAVLRQILLCLLTASLQSDAARTIKVEVSANADFIELSVGISRHRWSTLEAEPHVDEVDLLIDAALRLTESQGGVLRVESAPDSTYVTIVKLPAVRLVTILIVDDNPFVAQLFRRYLAGADYRLVQARTLPTALELARELRPDAIILDLMMPSRDGWEVLQELRSDPSLHDIPVIVCSILPERSLALSFGVADFLAKPVMQRDLLSALERCFGQIAPGAHRGYRADTSSPRQPLGHQPD
jgi:CheY-like chemotaxis protein